MPENFITMELLILVNMHTLWHHQFIKKWKKKNLIGRYSSCREFEASYTITCQIIFPKSIHAVSALQCIKMRASIRILASGDSMVTTCVFLCYREAWQGEGREGETEAVGEGERRETR